MSTFHTHKRTHTQTYVWPSQRQRNCWPSMPPLAAMDLERLLNRRQPRKRPASAPALVDLCSEPEEEVRDKPLSKPQLNFRVAYTDQFISYYPTLTGCSFNLDLYPTFGTRPEYPMPKTTEELSSETQMMDQQSQQWKFSYNRFLQVECSNQGCGPSSFWSVRHCYLERVLWCTNFANRKHLFPSEMGVQTQPIGSIFLVKLCSLLITMVLIWIPNSNSLLRNYQLAMLWFVWRSPLCPSWLGDDWSSSTSSLGCWMQSHPHFYCYFAQNQCCVSYTVIQIKTKSQVFFNSILDPVTNSRLRRPVAASSSPRRVTQQAVCSQISWPWWTTLRRDKSGIQRNWNWWRHVFANSIKGCASSDISSNLYKHRCRLLRWEFVALQTHQSHQDMLFQTYVHVLTSTWTLVRTPRCPVVVGKNSCGLVGAPCILFSKCPLLRFVETYVILIAKFS